MMADIKDVSVSSLNGLKTFALLLDVHKNHRDKFLFADPNFRLEANQSTPPLPTSLPDWDDGAKSWWLTDTNVLQAWDYSLGSGVRIAWLDLGTNHLNFGHSELLRKTDGNFLVNENMSLLADAVGAFDNHSLYCQMIGFAERNNTYIHSSGALAPLRTAGVAPNATVIPYNVLTHNDKVKASLKAAYKARVDVIGSSYGCLHCRDDVFRFFESISFEGNVLDQTIDWIVNGLHIPYVQAAGNSGTKLEQGKYGIHVSKNIPSGDTNNLIMAGAVVAPANRANNVYDNNSLTNYEVTRYSNFGENVIYAPGEGIWVSERTNPLNLTYMNGTSSAAPFVTGIVALMLSRNPDLLPAQILTILKNSSKTGLIDLKMPSLFSSGVGTIEFKNPSYALHPGQLKLIDVEEAVKQAITLRGSAPKSVEEHFGIIKEENGKKLLLNRFSDGTATPGEQSKAINWQTVSDNVWSELSDGAVVKIKSWSDISVGKIITYPPASFPFGSNVPIMGFRTPLYIGPNALEIQDVEKICDLKSGSAYYLQCPGPLAISPIINNLEIHQDSLHNIQNLNKDRGVEIDVDGNNLWVNNILSGSRVKVNFHEVYSTGIPVSPANTYAFDVYPQSIKNDGKQIKIKISNFEFFSKNIKSGHYRISLELLTGNTPLRGFVSSSGIDNFIVTDFGSGFSISSIQQPPTNATPENFGVKAFVEPNNTTPISVRAGDKVGVFVSRSLYSDIKIEIQGGNAVYTFINDNFLTFTIPAFLTIGNLDVLFKSNEGEFKIERLLNYTSPYPEVVKFSKPTIFANGGDVVDAYITVKDPNGQPAPDGTPYYVQLMPTQLGLYPDLTMIHPETGQQYGGRWTTVEQVLPVKNGKIHIQAKLNAPISPYEYTYDFNNNLPNVFTWPHANAPSFQVQVCNPAYNSSKPGYGYYCGQQLFPQTGNTLDGRLYAVHAYSFDPQIHHVTGGSIKRTITIRNIKDILGNPVPVGTVLHFNQTYYGNVSNPNGNDIYWGVAVTTPGEIDIVYEPFQRISCGLVGVEEYIYMTSVQGAASSSQHWLVGNPIYFRYVAC